MHARPHERCKLEHIRPLGMIDGGAAPDILCGTSLEEKSRLEAQLGEYRLRDGDLGEMEEAGALAAAACLMDDLPLFTPPSGYCTFRILRPFRVLLTHSMPALDSSQSSPSYSHSCLSSHSCLYSSLSSHYFSNI